MATHEMNSDAVEAQRREIESLKSELERAHEQLVEAERLASLGEMAAGMAHEIRNPLDLVNNFAALNVELLFELEDALANEENVGELVSDLKRNTAAVAHHASRADSIVGVLMQHAGSGRGRHERTDVNTFVDRFLRVSYQSRLSLHDNFHCDVERDYGDGVGDMLLNRHEMGRVLLNILGNAFDATEELAARRGRDYTPRVKVSTRRDEGFVEIRVSDNGPGISPDVRKKVFEPFFTTKQGGAGTGLGLSVSYDIVTGAHKGALSVEGSKGEGATIVIRLPWLQEPD